MNNRQLDRVLDRIKLTRSLERSNFASQEERWEPYGNNTCPICSDLHDLGWVPLGTLPYFRQAHSVIGEGRWNAPDSSCECTKNYRRVAGEGFSAQDGKKKIEELKLKYRNHKCDHGDKT